MSRIRTRWFRKPSPPSRAPSERGQSFGGGRRPSRIQLCPSTNLPAPRKYPEQGPRLSRATGPHRYRVQRDRVRSRELLGVQISFRARPRARPPRTCRARSRSMYSHPTRARSARSHTYGIRFAAAATSRDALATRIDSLPRGDETMLDAPHSPPEGHASCSSRAGPPIPGERVRVCALTLNSATTSPGGSACSALSKHHAPRALDHRFAASAGRGRGTPPRRQFLSAIATRTTLAPFTLSSA